ncbi:hypothetical protein M758_12G110300 [Ceratodon purpureus]|nr:hypothetical protein M758_12G110300 [Ceratodon purpureus]
MQLCYSSFYVKLQSAHFKSGCGPSLPSESKKDQSFESPPTRLRIFRVLTWDDDEAAVVATKGDRDLRSLKCSSDTDNRRFKRPCTASVQSVKILNESPLENLQPCGQVMLLSNPADRNCTHNTNH